MKRAATVTSEIAIIAVLKAMVLWLTCPFPACLMQWLRGGFFDLMLRIRTGCSDSRTVHATRFLETRKICLYMFKREMGLVFFFAGYSLFYFKYVFFAAYHSKLLGHLVFVQELFDCDSDVLFA